MKKNKNKEWKLGFSVTNLKINASVFDHSMLSHTGQSKEENVKTVNIYSLALATQMCIFRGQRSVGFTPAFLPPHHYGVVNLGIPVLEVLFCLCVGRVKLCGH